MTRLAAALVVLLAAAPAAAQAPTASRLAEAQRRLVEGDYEGALAITRPLVADAALPRADLAESFRLHGLSLYLLGREADAEIFLHHFLRLQPEAHLDPALVPPEAVAFLESIRARYEGELRALKPRPKRKRYWLLNLVPAAGQFQNDQAWKGWTFGITEGVLAATWISSYAILVSRCDADLTCSLKRSTAENLRFANLLSGAVWVGVYAIGVIDAMNGYNCMSAAERPPSVSLIPTDRGASLVWTMGF
jgi:hypothetical protein